MPKNIPTSKWGKDHWTTLLYIETVCVDGGGKPHASKMRHWEGRPLRGHGEGAFGVRSGRYPTRLIDGTEVHEHDDWDCVDDMVAEGLVLWEGTGTHPILRLTDRGWQIAHALRRHIAEAEKRSVLTFRVPEAA